jgi:hypothetical protein
LVATPFSVRGCAFLMLSRKKQGSDAFGRSSFTTHGGEVCLKVTATRAPTNVPTKTNHRVPSKGRSDCYIYIYTVYIYIYNKYSTYSIHSTVYIYVYIYNVYINCIMHTVYSTVLYCIYIYIYSTVQYMLYDPGCNTTLNNRFTYSPSSRRLAGKYLQYSTIKMLVT